MKKNIGLDGAKDIALGRANHSIKFQSRALKIDQWCVNG